MEIKALKTVARNLIIDSRRPIILTFIRLRGVMDESRVHKNDNKLQIYNCSVNEVDMCRYKNTEIRLRFTTNLFAERSFALYRYLRYVFQYRRFLSFSYSNPRWDINFQFAHSNIRKTTRRIIIETLFFCHCFF